MNWIVNGRTYFAIVFCSLTNVFVILNMAVLHEDRIKDLANTIADVNVQQFRNTVISVLGEQLYNNMTQLGRKNQNANCSAPDEDEIVDDNLNTTVPTWNDLNKKYSHVLRGGRSKPTHPSHKVVIIIPYRDRRVHLKIFLDHMHPFLQRQNLEYVIYVVEMGQKGLFNRAALSNAGFLEVIKREDTPCVIFHDVDTLPINDENLYYCYDTIRHYAVALDKHNFTLFYETQIGGIVAFPPKLFQKINGYSNLFEGWGGEDDDLYKRIVDNNIPWIRQSEKLGRYKSFEHERQPVLANRRKYLKWTTRRMRIDGLNSINYTVVAIEEKPLFTWILVNITKGVDTLTNIEPIYKEWKQPKK